MQNKKLQLEIGTRYSNIKERYSMIPNWLFDEGEYIELDVYERLVFIYMIRLTNKKQGKGIQKDRFYVSAETVAKKCGFSERKVKDVIKSLQEKGFIKKVSTGNNLNRRANTYQMMYLQPVYEQGRFYELIELKDKLPKQQYEAYEEDGVEFLFYHESKDIYSTREWLPLLQEFEADIETETEASA